MRPPKRNRRNQLELVKLREVLSTGLAVVLLGFAQVVRRFQFIQSDRRAARALGAGATDIGNLAQALCRLQGDHGEFAITAVAGCGLLRAEGRWWEIELVVGDEVNEARAGAAFCSAWVVARRFFGAPPSNALAYARSAVRRDARGAAAVPEPLIGMTRRRININEMGTDSTSSEGRWYREEPVMTVPHPQTDSVSSRDLTDRRVLPFTPEPMPEERGSGAGPSRYDGGAGLMEWSRPGEGAVDRLAVGIGVVPAVFGVVPALRPKPPDPSFALASTVVLLLLGFWLLLRLAPKRQ
jgi:hypothetical protein